MPPHASQLLSSSLKTERRASRCTCRAGARRQNALDLSRAVESDQAGRGMTRSWLVGFLGRREIDGGCGGKFLDPSAGDVALQSVLQHEPAVSRQSFIWFITSSIWRSMGVFTTSRVTGSKAGNPEIWTAPACRVTAYVVRLSM